MCVFKCVLACNCVEESGAVRCPYGGLRGALGRKGGPAMEEEEEEGEGKGAADAVWRVQESQKMS